MPDINNYIDGAKSRASVVRLRTWTLTLAILVCLGFYLVVSVTTKQAISWIDFALLSIMQIVVYSIYFPDGDLYGQRSPRYLSNKKAYNEKAADINKNKQISQLREYCKYEFEERKKAHILNQCGILGITLEELDTLKQKTEDEIEKIESIVVKYLENGEEREKIVTFSKKKKKILKKLLFEPIPVEENHPETIMSAVENKRNKAIRDGSVSYKTLSYVKKVIKAVVIGGIFAYIGYKAKDGFGIAEIVTMCMYVTTMFSTAVMAYAAGENCSKVYKATFYLELANFIDGFTEWLIKNSPSITKEESVIVMQQDFQPFLTEENKEPESLKEQHIEDKTSVER